MPYDDDFGLDDEYGLDDDFGSDAEFGASERRIARLLQRRSKLESLMSVVGPNRQRRIGRRLARIDRVLERSGYSAAQGMTSDAMAASGIEGVGGLMFQAQAPPGLGRLVRLPFYPANATAGVITSAGQDLASTVNPIQIINLTGLAANSTSEGPHTLVTPQVSWATLRLVGFETQQQIACPAGEELAVVVCSDLQIGGGANLFTHEDFADANIYDADQPEFCGLRDYPLLKSPNTAQVQVQMVQGQTPLGGGATGCEVAFSCSLLCEVILDDNYGAHIPGPYARKGALVRQGGSFIR